MLPPLKNHPETFLQEEILRERAAVLFRAGHRVADLLAEMQEIGRRIEEKRRALGNRSPRCPAEREYDPPAAGRCSLEEDIHRDIETYNRLQRRAGECFHELIVIREALGMRRHYWIEQHYRIPPRQPFCGGT